MRFLENFARSLSTKGVESHSLNKTWSESTSTSSSLSSSSSSANFCNSYPNASRHGAAAGTGRGGPRLSLSTLWRRTRFAVSFDSPDNHLRDFQRGSSAVARYTGRVYAENLDSNSMARRSLARNTVGEAGCCEVKPANVVILC